MTEADFQDQIVQWARLRGWRLYHTYNSRGSDAGFPDLVLVRESRCVVAELKTETGAVSAAQMEWLEALADAGVETYVWRPSVLESALEALR